MGSMTSLKLYKALIIKVQRVSNLLATFNLTNKCINYNNKKYQVQELRLKFKKLFKI
jgi:hypothetical protein